MTPAQSPIADSYAISLPWPSPTLSPRLSLPWSEADDQFLLANHGTMTIRALGTALGRSAGAVRGHVTRLGIAKNPKWTADEVDGLVALYQKAGSDGVLNLSAFAASIGKENGNVCRKARSLGLAINPGRKLVETRKPKGPPRKFDSPEALSAATAERMRRWHQGNPHPMLGKTHSSETRRKIGAASKASQLFQSDEQRQARILKAMKTKVERHGKVVTNHRRGTWAAGWREIGGKRNYYRSRWEANYARYLQWLKDLGQITEWQHEPETFWFEAIRRGTRSYLPDFRVWETDGTTALHEVKGWMDQRSRTTLARMKKYHPQERIVLIDGVQYRAIRRKVMGLVPGWEDAARDSHA